MHDEETLPGKEIHRTYDEYGPIQVFDDGTKRYLSFGEGDEQSCILKARPELLQHEYTRAMLLPTLFCEPRSAVLIGLGGGAVPTCLFHHWPDLRLHVIELRRAVVKIARRYFDLPQSERIQIVEQDVAEFFDQPLAQRVDMVFSDIYGAEVMDMQYFQPWYIEACARLLNDDGWLIMNCWDEHRGEQDTLQALTEEFAEVYSCTVSTGNWIIFASKRPNTIDQAKLKMAAKKQSKQLGFSVTENLFKLFKVFPKD